MSQFRLVQVFSFLGVALLLGACQQPSTSDVDQTEEGVLRLGSVAAIDTVNRAVAPNDRPLVIDGFRGTVALRGGDQSTAEFQFVRQGRGQDAEAARGVLDDVAITESGSDQSYTYALETDGDAYATVDVRGTVPRATELRVEQSTGPVSISGVDGPLTVEHDHGPVTIEGAAGSIDVEIKNGDIRAELRSLPADASVSLQTANGDVTLGLPPAASVQLDAQTNVGVIRTQGLSLGDERFMPRDAGGQYTAQTGAGDVPVDVQAQNGSILVQAVDATVPDEMPSADTVSTPTDAVAPPADTTAPRPDEETNSDTSTSAPPMSPDTTMADTTGS